MATNQTKEQDQLTILFPTGKEVLIRDKVYCITPFKLGQYPRVIKAITPLANVYSDAIKNNLSQLDTIMALLGEGGENAMDLIRLSTDETAEWVSDLNLDEGIELLGALIEVNADFFIKKILPQLTKAVETVSGQMQ